MTVKTSKLRDAIKFALAVGAIAGTGSAFAQDPAATSETETTELDRIEVTGSRIKRADVETSQPIFSLNREDIQAQGLTSVGDVIQNITSNGSTLNSTFNNGGNGETRVSLRNLGSNRTLVLVNGRRWVGGTGLGGAVDLNTIPTAAVERIEVLKDGASTIYGSDAIAGVVNVILRQNYDGAEANAYLGVFDKGDGMRQAYDFTVGTTSDRWSAMMGVGYVQEDPVMAGDREISAVPNFGATAGFGNSGTPPIGRFSINGRRPDGTAGQFTGDRPGPLGFRNYNAVLDNYNFAPDNYLITPQERISLFAQGSLDITDSLRFKTTVTFNERKSEQLLAANPIVLGVIAPGTNGANVVISRNSIYNPFGQDINGIQYRPNELGGRSFNQNVDTFAFNGGFEGTLTFGEKYFDWEAGYFYGKNEQNDVTNGLFNISALRLALGPSFIDPATGRPTCGTLAAPIGGGCVPLNLLDGAGSVTPEMGRYIGFVAHDQFGYEQKNYYANIGGDLFELPAGPLGFSFGVESRKESGFDEPDALINLGDTTGNARKSTAGGYSVDEAYLELAIPVLADLPFAKLLDFSVATRYSEYSNFGDTLNSKFGFRWKPIDDLMIRGNWSEGFRAPSISELFTGVSDSFPEISDPCAGSIQGDPNTERAACPGIPAYDQQNTQIRTLVGGNVDLGPENSVSKTLGFVYSPSFVEGLDVSLDWWEIEVENAIFTQGAQSILDSCYRNGSSAACGLITRAPDGQISRLLATPANVGTIFNEGVDLTVGYRLPETSFGKFRFVWDTTYLISSTTDVNGDGVVSEDPVNGESGDTVGEYFSRNNNWRIRSNIAANWEMGDFGVNWNVRYFSRQDESCFGVTPTQRVNLCSDPTRFTNLDGDDADRLPDGPAARPENRIPSAVYNDVSAYVNVPWNAKVTVGVNNVFDRDPPRSASTFANSFDPQYEVPGRFFYMRYTQKF